MPKFEPNDFPENPDWGIERKFLDYPNDVDYRKNTGDVNFARAFAEAKKQGLSDDLCLAVAACVRESGYGIKPDRNYPMDGMEVTVKAVEGLPDGMTSPPLVEMTVSYVNGNNRRFSMEQILQHHIPTLTGRELTNGAQLPEELWHMATHPAAGKTPIKLGRMHVSDGWMNHSPTRVIGLYSPSIDEKRAAPVLYAKFPIDRLDLAANERALLSEAGEDGFALVMKERSTGNKIDGKERTELAADVRAYREAVARRQDEARAARNVLREADAAMHAKPTKPKGLLDRLGKAFGRKK